MSGPVQRPETETTTRAVALAAGGLVVAALAAYANSFAGPFVFDDVPAIVENPSIRRLWPLSEVIAPQVAGGLTVSGRPVVNLSLALNYAVGGIRPEGYHAANLLIHVLAGLAFFGVVRRTLLLPALRERFGRAALPLALAVAAVWTLHPLQTESVTYVVQRAESLAGLFVLLTLYAFIRGATGLKANRWFAVSVGACAFAMASKEVAVSVPLLALLYDRTFLTGSFRAAWHARSGIFLSLAATWLLLGALVLATAGRGGTAGFGTAMPAWSYALTQCGAIVRYLGLSLWPHPLVFDYGLSTVRNLTAVWPQALLLLALVTATVMLIVRRPAAGFLGAWFFALLAPSSSVVPVVTQTMAEHRMYLPLAAVAAVAVLASYVWRARIALAFWVTAAVALASATSLRNRDYRSEIAIWGDTADKWPTNARAHNNLGQALFRAGREAEAIRSYECTLELQPNYPETHYNLGVALAKQGKLEAAIAHYETAVRLQPDYPAAHNNLGNALARANRRPEARLRYEEALRLDPQFTEARNNLGNALLAAGRAGEAVEHFQKALRLKPAYAEARYNLGNAFAALQRMAEALESYRHAIRLRPAYADAHVNAGNALLQLERPAEAIAHFEQAVAHDPALAVAHFNLGSALLDLERWAEAIPRFEQALRADPVSTDAHRALGFALAQVGRTAAAITHYEMVVRAIPGDTATREALNKLRARPDGGKPR